MAFFGNTVKLNPIVGYSKDLEVICLECSDFHTRLDGLPFRESEKEDYPQGLGCNRCWNNIFPSMPNVEVETMQVVDNDTIKTAIIVDRNNPEQDMASVVVCRPDGSVICKLNIFDFGYYADIDVITEEPGIKTVKAWSDGRAILDQQVTSKVVAVLVGDHIKK